MDRRKQTWCRLPTTSSNDGANALFTYKNTLSVLLHFNFFLRYLTTSSNLLVALIVQTSFASEGADPTGLNRTTTLSFAKLPALASAAVASRGRSARTTEADSVRGRSGDAVPLGLGLMSLSARGGGDGESFCFDILMLSEWWILLCEGWDEL